RLIEEIPRAKTITPFFRAAGNVDIMTRNGSGSVHQVLPVCIDVFRFVQSVACVWDIQFTEFHHLRPGHQWILAKNLLGAIEAVVCNGWLLSLHTPVGGHEYHPIGPT